MFAGFAPRSDRSVPTDPLDFLPANAARFLFVPSLLGTRVTRVLVRGPAVYHDRIFWPAATDHALFDLVFDLLLGCVLTSGDNTRSDTRRSTLSLSLWEVRSLVLPTAAAEFHAGTEKDVAAQTNFCFSTSPQIAVRPFLPRFTLDDVPGCPVNVCKVRQLRRVAVFLDIRKCRVVVTLVCSVSRPAFLKHEKNVGEQVQHAQRSTQSGEKTLLNVLSRNLTSSKLESSSENVLACVWTSPSSS